MTINCSSAAFSLYQHRKLPIKSLHGSPPLSLSLFPPNRIRCAKTRALARVTARAAREFGPVTRGLVKPVDARAKHVTRHTRTVGCHRCGWRVSVRCYVPRESNRADTRAGLMQFRTLSRAVGFRYYRPTRSDGALENLQPVWDYILSISISPFLARCFPLKVYSYSYKVHS